MVARYLHTALQWLHAYWKSSVVALCIVYCSLVRQPLVALPTFPQSDKWGHAAAYLLWGMVISWDLWRDAVVSRGRKLCWSVLFPCLFGGVIEILQEQFFYPRRGDWFDWLADIAGTLLGCGLFYVFHRLWTRSSTK